MFRFGRSIKKSARGSAQGLKSVFSRKQKSDLTHRSVLSVTKKRTLPSWSQWKHLPRVMNRAEKITVLVALVLIITALVIVGTRYVSVHQVVVPAIGGEYVEGLVGAPQFINPLYSSANDVDNDIARLVFSGLMKWTPKQGLIPDLAESYEISEDQLVYTFTLRDGARWHDGEQVRVRDIIYTIKTIQSTDYKSPLDVSFAGVQVEQVDDQTVRFTLDEPFSPFLSTLTVGILPAHIWGAILPVNAQLTEQNLKPIGSGPYMFDKFTKESKSGAVKSYTVARNPHYYDEPAKLESITFKFYLGIDEAVSALKNKNVEGLGFIPQEVANEFSDSNQYNIYRPSLPQYVAIFFNDEKQIFLQNDKLRQVLDITVDRNKIVEEVFMSQATAVNSPILPGMLGYQEYTAPPSDIVRAKELLDEANWKLTQEEGVEAVIREKKINGETRQLEMTLTVANTPELIKVAELIQAQWEQLGMALNLELVDLQFIYSEVIAPREYEMLLTGELLGTDPDPYPFWHSSQIEDPGLNLSLYGNRKADKLLDDARAISNPEERAEKYQAFQDILAEDLPAVFLYQPTYSYIVTDKILNIDLPQIIFPDDRFSEVNSWYIKTKKRLTR